MEGSSNLWEAISRHVDAKTAERKAFMDAAPEQQAPLSAVTTPRVISRAVSGDNSSIASDNENSSGNSSNMSIPRVTPAQMTNAASEFAASVTSAAAAAYPALPASEEGRVKFMIYDYEATHIHRTSSESQAGTGNNISRSSSSSGSLLGGETPPRMSDAGLSRQSSLSSNSSSSSSSSSNGGQGSDGSKAGAVKKRGWRDLLSHFITMGWN